jgi:hypothetical protein
VNEKEIRAMERAIKIAVQNYKKDFETRTGKTYGKSSPAKTGAANKAKAQGAKAMGASTSGYGKSTKPKGK